MSKCASCVKGPAECSYGVSHFCDGTPNPSQGGKMKREPCKYYKCEGLRAGGKCTSSRVR